MKIRIILQIVRLWVRATKGAAKYRSRSKEDDAEKANNIKEALRSALFILAIVFHHE
jgi:hypothetical protein